MISPFIFVFFAFIFTLVNRIYTKKVLYDLDGYAVAFLTNLLSAILVFPFLIYFYPNWYVLNSFEIFITLILGILWTYVAWIGNLSIAQNNFSFKEIIRQTRIIWVVLVGVFLLGENFFLKDFLGIGLIILSVFIISYKTFSFREHVSSDPILLAWSVAFVAAGIVILEKIILNTVPVTVYAFSVYILPTLFLLPFLKKNNFLQTKKIYLENKKEIFWCTIFMLISYFSALYSYKLLPISIAYPIIQSSTVVGILVATFVFENREDVPKKVFASVVAILGVLVIKFF